jgi:lipoate-protein ligase B
MNILDLGRINYESCLKQQLRLHERRRKGLIADAIVIAEHTHIITAGRTFKPCDLPDVEVLNRSGIKLLHTDRGGSITYHGPGQLVCYPIVDLSRFNRDLHKFLNVLEAVVIDSLNSYNIRASSKSGARGVWVQDRKIASVGIAVKRWVSYHGIAINIDMDMSYFKMINPCGLNSEVMISLSDILRKPISIDEYKERFIKSLDKYFLK